MHNVATLEVAPDIALYHVGPSLDHGPLPSLFYFALSGRDSLAKDPYNQPVQFLQKHMFRSFSMDLPAHENQLSPTDALTVWAEDFSRGYNCLGEFLDKTSQAIDFAIRERFVDPKKLAIAGLSRGGLIAAHIAARDERFRFLLAFAPMTKLGVAKEFSHLREDPTVRSFDTLDLAQDLCNRHIRIYIGNRDTRVETRSCFEFAAALADKAYEKKIRSPQIEFIMSPSTGQMGHGTPPEVFRAGSMWIAECLK